MATKRPYDDGQGTDEGPDNKKAAPKELCIFGQKCYRRNPHHFREYSHPHLESLSSKESLEEDVLKDQWDIVKSLGLLKKSKKEPQVEQRNEPKANQRTQPRNEPKANNNVANVSRVFLTKVQDVPSTHVDGKSVYLTDILHSKYGTLKSSVQINFMVELEWLLMNYEATGNDQKPLLILYGEENQDLLGKNHGRGNVTSVRIRSPYPFGTHHTKLMILVYQDESVRVVVSTANLISSDWQNRTQGLWLGPKCPKGQGDGETRFKASLLKYLEFYGVSQLKPYIEHVAQCDFSQVNAFFVASVPGSHSGAELASWGHMAVGSVLRKHAKKTRWPLNIQCSSIGSLGNNPKAWMCSELADSLSSGTCDDVQMIYPSKKNVFRSLDGLAGGGCLPYRRKGHEKQVWLRDFLYEWKSEGHNRSAAMPHIKTYAQVSPDGKEASFFLLTSSNLSKAAWGTLNKGRDKLYIMSYEAGVLLLPQFVVNKDTFELEHHPVLPYDVPLTKYQDSDTPWFMDYLVDSQL